MVGGVFLAMQFGYPDTFIDSTFTERNFTIPTAPADGLMLNQPVMGLVIKERNVMAADNYYLKSLKNFNHKTAYDLTPDNEDEVEEFRQELVEFI